MGSAALSRLKDDTGLTTLEQAGQAATKVVDTLDSSYNSARDSLDTATGHKTATDWALSSMDTLEAAAVTAAKGLTSLPSALAHPLDTVASITQTYVNGVDNFLNGNASITNLPDDLTTTLANPRQISRTVGTAVGTVAPVLLGNEAGMAGEAATAGDLGTATKGESLGAANASVYASTSPLSDVFPELDGINPHYVDGAGPGVNTNCTSCANAANARLTGSDPTAVADNTGYANGTNALLPSAPWGFGNPESVQSATADLLARGEGATSPLIIQQSDGINHVINGIVRNGKVYWVDTKIGKIVTLQTNITVRLGRPP